MNIDGKKQRLADLEAFVRLAREHQTRIENEFYRDQLSRRETWLVILELTRAAVIAEFEAASIRFKLDMAAYDPAFEEKTSAWLHDGTEKDFRCAQDAIKLEGLRTRPYDIYYQLLDERFYELYGKEK